MWEKAHPHFQKKQTVKPQNTSFYQSPIKLSAAKKVRKAAHVYTAGEWTQEGNLANLSILQTHILSDPECHSGNLIYGHSCKDVTWYMYKLMCWSTVCTSKRCRKSKYSSTLWVNYRCMLPPYSEVLYTATKGKSKVFFMYRHRKSSKGISLLV